MAEQLIITRAFAATPDEVWQMWTTPANFAAWFGTLQIPIPLESVALDVRVGGAWKATMELPDDMRIDWTGEYTEVDRPSRLAFTLSDEPGHDPGLPVLVEITAVDGGSEMTLTQHTPDFSDEQFEMTVAGYNGFFDDMASLLAR